MKEEIKRLACNIIDKTGLEISESNRLDIIEKAVNTAMDHIATRLVEIPLPGLPYLKVKLCVWGEPAHARRSALVVFVRKENLRTLKVQVGAWFDGRVIYTDTIICPPGDEHIEAVIRESIRAMRSLALLEDKQNFEDYLLSVKAEPTLSLKADFVTPTNLLEVLINKGANDAVNLIRESEYSTLWDMCKSQLDLVHIIVDAGKACDGVMAEFAGKMVRIANELPMIEQEAKSYATNNVTELLAPYRLESDQRKMISWGSW
ncbi:hypothetical protein ACUAWQ_004246 [Escherichia coli]|uniref:hypothetical protein n=1 Tax=Escherichia coli TaxID=562 RepID=UPI0009FE0191|nr:hypothetical protein [Escherichia coli]MCZ8590852.1 hypothetical protein [Escherichia albertii]EEX1657640.1 hypothetical protein [Escherichia coli]EFD8988274.1 hypothetical protein [Escherichia coli]EFE9806906.1 hypothetical protein [Escherichia coli]EFH0076127.1 hypothetical protein [Escherichia coli]